MGRGCSTIICPSDRRNRQVLHAPFLYKGNILFHPCINVCLVQCTYIIWTSTYFLSTILSYIYVGGKGVSTPTYKKRTIFIAFTLFNELSGGAICIASPALWYGIYFTEKTFKFFFSWNQFRIIRQGVQMNCQPCFMIWNRIS